MQATRCSRGCAAAPAARLRAARAGQDVRERFSGCAADLTVIAVLAAGNDYLPALRGTSLNDSATTPSLWSLYLRLRDQPEWATQCAPRAHEPEPPARC